MDVKKIDFIKMKQQLIQIIPIQIIQPIPNHTTNTNYKTTNLMMTNQDQNQDQDPLDQNPLTLDPLTLDPLRLSCLDSVKRRKGNGNGHNRPKIEELSNSILVYIEPEEEEQPEEEQPEEEPEEEESEEEEDEEEEEIKRKDNNNYYQIKLDVNGNEYIEASNVDYNEDELRMRRFIESLIIIH